MLDEQIIRNVESHLKMYYFYDDEIAELERSLTMQVDNAQDVNSYIQSKNKISQKVANKAINNIIIKDKIEFYKKWKEIIKVVLEEYKETDKLKHDYMIYKFFRQYQIPKIEMLLYIKSTMQNTLRHTIIYRVALLAVQEKLIKL
ncbi:MAG: hypothetical protein Q4G05_00350 [Clostridia bacterium]|nr:hypothetical protein [Clostridia bacterium]